VDQLVGSAAIQFEAVVPFIILLSVVIVVRAGLTVVRKYLVENIATQTDKDQTVKVIERLLKVDSGGFLINNKLVRCMGASPDRSKGSSVFSNSLFGFYAGVLCRPGRHWHRFFTERADCLRHGSRHSYRVVSDCQTDLFTERDSGSLIKTEGTGRRQSD
jgi:hypothetical protein